MLLQSVRFSSGHGPHTFRTSQQGRRYYGAHISKPAWRPGEFEEIATDTYSLDPDRCFHIHFEPQFNALSGQINLYLHYELNPYRPERWAQQYLVPSSYQEYQARRERFIAYLQSQPLPGFRLGGRYNQIARADFPIDATTTVTDFTERLVEMIKPIAGIIDQFGG